MICIISAKYLLKTFSTKSIFFARSLTLNSEKIHNQLLLFKKFKNFVKQNTTSRLQAKGNGYVSDLIGVSCSLFYFVGHQCITMTEIQYALMDYRMRPVLCSA